MRNRPASHLYLGSVPPAFEQEYRPLAAASSKAEARKRAAAVLNEAYRSQNGREPRGLNKVLPSEIALFRVDLATGVVEPA